MAAWRQLCRSSPASALHPDPRSSLFGLLPPRRGRRAQEEACNSCVPEEVAARAAAALPVVEWLCIWHTHLRTAGWPGGCDPYASFSARCVRSVAAAS
jgi:hypothetical protein